MWHVEIVVSPLHDVILPWGPPTPCRGSSFSRCRDGALSVTGCLLVEGIGIATRSLVMSVIDLGVIFFIAYVMV